MEKLYIIVQFIIILVIIIVFLLFLRIFNSISKEKRIANFSIIALSDKPVSFIEKLQNLYYLVIKTISKSISKSKVWTNYSKKNEKFVVVSGEGVIRFRKINSSEVIEYKVSGEKIEVIDIPCGYTHNIENTGNTDMVTIMWANEVFNPEQPDTYYMEV